MKRIYFLFYLGIAGLTVNAQASQPPNAQTTKPLTIEDCYTLAQQNYPLVKQRELISKSKTYSIGNASKGYMPQVSINGQATYQSDVTEIPIKLPNVNIPTISKDQYRVYGEVNQTIYDGGVIKTQKESMEAGALVETQKLEVELEKIKERINQLFFGILMVDEQLAQIEILQKDIQLGIDKANAAISNGVGLKTSADALKAELLKTNQRVIELKATRKAYLDMLSLFLNQPLSENTELKRPANIILPQAINRPELLLIENQKKMLDIQSKLIYSKNLPKVGLFIQGGFGRPALNMLNNDLAGYYIGGIRLNWSLSGFYTYKNEKAIIGINNTMLDIQKETFLFNTNFTLKQQNAEVIKLQELIKSDEEIITLRTKIKNTSLAQLENGVITSSDYIRELNAEDQAKQNKMMHEIQLLMAQYAQKLTMEN